jgi:competence protein ComGC
MDDGDPLKEGGSGARRGDGKAIRCQDTQLYARLNDRKAKKLLDHPILIIFEFGLEERIITAIEVGRF